MMNQRASGILLHLTSLPSAYGIGDLGPEAYRFVDFLSEAGQSIWQVLPLNPIDGAHANSPYSSASAFAGNRLLISPELLMRDGFISERDIQPVPEFKDGTTDYDAVKDFKDNMLQMAWDGFRIRTDREEFEDFCHRNRDWLDDFALFVSIKQSNGGDIWSDWPEDVRDRRPDRLSSLRKELVELIDQQKFIQYLFFRQWGELRRYANSKGVRIMGDVPIYVNFDSADTWSNTRIFKLNSKKCPVAVAGVPPDYFSKTGQLWGNPVYDWEYLQRTGFDWWLRRMAQVFSLCDLVRIDHFRGLVAYWEVPAGHKTAVKGKWVDVPTDEFLLKLIERFGELPVVAEDLGTITPDVTEVMERYNLPGMKILLFAFGEDNPEHPYLPRNFEENTVVYTGTHDNNTARGWFEHEAAKADKKRLFDYLDREVTAGEVAWAMVELAMKSPARTAIVPMQDVLGLGEEARMNTPATRNGNWQWRLMPNQITPEVTGRLADLTGESDR